MEKLKTRMLFITHNQYLPFIRNPEPTLQMTVNEQHSLVLTHPRMCNAYQMIRRQTNL